MTRFNKTWYGLFICFLPSFLLSATYLLKRTKKNTFGLGIVGLIDPLARFPVIPIVSYTYNFDDGHWVFQGILPYRTYFRRDVLNSGWLSLGAELQGNNFFNDGINLPQVGLLESSTSDLWIGGIFEYPLSEYFIAGFKTGLRTGIQAQLREIDKPSRDPIAETNVKPSMYFNFSISLTIPKK